MKSTTVARALVAVGVIGAVSLQFFGPDDAPKDTETRSHFVVKAGDQTATVLCEGDVVGTGFLAAKDRAIAACTFDSNVVVHQYLQGRASCADVIAAGSAGDFYDGEATITGVYFGDRIRRVVDADGGECDRAAARLLAPLLPQ